MIDSNLPCNIVVGSKGHVGGMMYVKHFAPWHMGLCTVAIIKCERVLDLAVWSDLSNVIFKNDGLSWKN